MKEISFIENIRNRSNTGSQIKWKIKDKWYKIDDFNYEGLSETIVSDMLKTSNVEKYAIYEPEEIKYKGVVYSGCVSDNFLSNDEILIEASLALKRAKIDTDNLTIQEFINAVKKLTGLNDFDKYLTKMYELDQIILNTDRHYSNIAILQTTYGFDYAPFFDQGRAFALRDDLWNSGKTPEEIIESVDPRLHIGNFEKQTKELEELSGGKFLELTYTKDDLRKTLDKCSFAYSDEILKRAETIVSLQIDKNIEYFKGDAKDQLWNNIKQKINKNLVMKFDFKENGHFLSAIPQGESEISFSIDTKGKITPLNNGSPTTDEALIFNHSGMFDTYRRLYYAIQEDKTYEEKELQI